jgi:hypothetical protein
MRKPPHPPARRLGAIRTLLSLMLVSNVLLLINAALVKVSGQIVANFEVSVELVYGPQPFVLQQANRHLTPTTVNVYVQNPALVQTLLGLLVHGLAQGLATLPMIILARRLVDRVIADGPFTMSMVGGLRRLGLVVLVGGFLAELVRSAAVIALYASAVPGGHPFIDTNWMIDLWWLLLGLVILAFAQVIEHGCALRAELDEVI